MPADRTGTDLDAALAGRKVVALFHATWCPFCRAFAPVFRRLAPSAVGYQPLEVVLDDDEDPLWTRFDVGLVPTVVFFDDGTITARLDGRPGVGIDEPMLLEALERAR
ncbi:MAG: thioredoxin family protein [Deltaproteobacteria bacterium]|nr:thioredoxin family protein [Deltaproteobacteria bacterium]